MLLRTAAEVKQRYPTCSTIPFEYVTDFFNRVAKSRGSRKKSELAGFRTHFINREADDLFQLVRGSYGLKETHLATALIKACGIPSNSLEATAVKDWKKPGTEFAGDFASVAEHYLFVPNCGREARTIRSTEYTVGQLNEDLDRLAAAKSDERSGILKTLIVRTSPVQMKWITNIILRSLKIGLSENVVFADFHRDAMKLYDSTMDLEKVCSLLKNPSIRHQIKDIEPGIPARPQLAAQKRSPEQILSAMEMGDFVVEIKFDGERCQLHRRGDTVMYYSRNGIDHSNEAHFNLFDAVIKRQLLKENCILDGELIIWNRTTECFEPFGSLRHAIKAAAAGGMEDTNREYEDFRERLPGKRRYQLPDLEDIEVVYMAFDILYVDDHSITAVSLRQRQEILRASVKDAPMNGVPIGGGLRGRVIPLIPDRTFLSGHLLSIQGTDLEDITDMMNKAVLMQEEGIVVKALESAWVMNDRGDHWVKMKPDYVSNHDIDALIIGGYYGTGKNANSISEFLLGITDKGFAESPRFISFCRVGSGLSDKERLYVQSIIQSNMKPLKKPPKHYRISGRHKETPDEWIVDPKKSVVLQVTADIRTVCSEVFAAGYTLRFPRVTAVRLDKVHDDIMTLQELHELIHRYDGSLFKGEKSMGTPFKSPSSRKRSTSVPLHYLPTPAKTRKQEEAFLKNLIVCFCDYGLEGKERLERLVQERGAVVYMNPSRCVNFVLGANPKSQTFRRVARDGKYDIVSVKWLLKCEKALRKLPLRPQDYLKRATTAIAEVGDLLKGEDPKADLEAADIEQVVSIHMEQPTIKARHPWMKETMWVHCPEMPIEEIFEGSTRLARCCFYKLRSSEDPAGVVDSESTSLQCHTISRWRRLKKNIVELQAEAKVLLSGAEDIKELTCGVTHIILDSVCEDNIHTPEDFLNSIAWQMSSDFSFEEMKDALEQQHLFIVSSKWISRASIDDILRPHSMVEAAPLFARESMRIDITTKNKVLSVEGWPWNKHLDTHDFQTPRPRRRSNAAANSRLESILLTNPRRTRHRSGLKASSGYSTELSSIHTPVAKRSRYPEESLLVNNTPEGVLGSSPRSRISSSRLKKTPTFFEAIPGEDSDAMDIDDASSSQTQTPNQELESEGSTTPVRMQLRSQSSSVPRQASGSKRKVSIKEKLASIKR